MEVGSEQRVTLLGHCIDGLSLSPVSPFFLVQARVEVGSLQGGSRKSRVEVGSVEWKLEVYRVEVGSVEWKLEVNSG